MGVNDVVNFYIILRIILLQALDCEAVSYKINEISTIIEKLHAGGEERRNLDVHRRGQEARFDHQVNQVGKPDFGDGCQLPVQLPQKFKINNVIAVETQIILSHQVRPLYPQHYVHPSSTQIHHEPRLPRRLFQILLITRAHLALPLSARPLVVQRLLGRPKKTSIESSK